MAGPENVSRTPGGEPVPRISRAVVLLALGLLGVGLVVALVGQQRLTQEVRPTPQYIDGRYWTIDPGTCLGAGVDTKAACVALDSATAADLERSHENLVTIRSMGVVLMLSGMIVLVVAFVGSRRAAERLLSVEAGARTR